MRPKETKLPTPDEIMESIRTSTASGLLRDLIWHVVTKAQALVAWIRGDRGAARVLWRWMANRPTPADLEQAKRDLARPHTQAELARLRISTPHASPVGGTE